MDALRRQGFEAWAVALPRRHTWEPAYLRTLLTSARRAEVVVIQKKLFHPLLLGLLARLNPRLVFDFDDALYARPSDLPERAFRRRQLRGRLGLTLRLARHVIAGNRVLADYARPRTRAVTIIPSALDLDELPPRVHLPSDRIRIGWIGRHSNLGHLSRLVPALRRLRAEVGEAFELHVFADGVDREPFAAAGVPVVNTAWTPELEYPVIDRFDIGVMPLVDDEWTRGKCGFKLLQYMSRGVAAVASPVGANCDIVRDGVNGFLASADAEWAEKLRALIEDPALRARLGEAGRQTVAADYSFRAIIPRLADLLADVATT
jgi:glycosyltransferase involved in cell wall biosynthesis